jgi:hypothetical protein
MRKVRKSRHLFLGWKGLGALVLLCTLPARGADTLPWPDGERLTYEIAWGPFVAAHARYEACVSKTRPGFLEVECSLKTHGATDRIYPVEAMLHSIIEIKPWRSLQLNDIRTQAGRPRNVIETVDYPSRRLMVSDLVLKKKASVPIKKDALDDLVSLLYSVRMSSWGKTAARSFYVYDEKSAERADATYLGLEALPDQPDRLCRVIQIRPVYKDPEKNAAGYGAKAWLTDDARQVPLLIEMALKFGTVKIRLMKD